MVLLHAFIKKSQKTPTNDLELAKSQRNDVLEDLDFRVCTKRMFSQFSEKRKQLYANSFFKFGFISRFCLKAFVYAAFALPETD